MASKRRKKKREKRRAGESRPAAPGTDAGLDPGKAQQPPRPFVESTDEAHKAMTRRLAKFLNKEVVPIENPGLPKLSNAVIELIRPLLDEDDDFQELKGKITMAVCAWNASLLPPEKHDGYLEPFISSVPEEMRPPFVRDFHLLVRRKLEEFPDDRRPILDWQTTGEGDRVNLKASSLIHPDDLPHPEQEPETE